MIVLTKVETSRERALEQELRRKLEELGPYDSVKRFFSKYANVRTRCVYAVYLALYFRWLKGQGVILNPDALLNENLENVYGSGPTDVARKRRHTDLLNSYVNGYLVEGGKSDADRKVRAAAIMMFYKRNDSPLFGDFSLALKKADQARPAPRFQPETSGAS